MTALRSVVPLELDGGGTETLPAPVQSLLDAVLVLSEDLDLRSVLSRLVEAAATLTRARYGALGVLDDSGNLAEFITTGIEDEDRARIGAEPRGLGLLGVLIENPRPLRLDDLSTHAAAVGFPPEHPPMGSFLGVPIRIRDTVFGNLYLTEKDGASTFTAQDELLVQALANVAGMVIENARAYGLSERRRQWLEATAELVESLQPPIDLDSALSIIARNARRTSGAAVVAIVQAPDGEEKPVIAASDGLDAWESAPLVRRILAEVRTAEARSMAVDVALSEGHAEVHPLCAHLTDPGSLVAIFDQGSGARGPEEREFLATFVDQASLALDRAEAVEGREQLAVVSERARIARDLHDVVIQRLFAAGLKLQSVDAGAAQHQVEARVESVVEDLDLTIKDIRTTIFELQQEKTSVRSAIERLVVDYSGILGFKPTVSVRGPVEVLADGPVADHLLAVLREALSNVARHARAREVSIEIECAQGNVVLHVLDDGRGIPAQRTESGLRNARERAALLGGTLVVASYGARGTTLTWTCPVTT